MSGFINAGLVTGIGTVIWTFVMGFTGWYKDPALMACSSSSRCSRS